MMETAGDPPGEINHALKESSARDHYFTGELQGSNKGLEIH